MHGSVITYAIGWSAYLLNDYLRPKRPKEVQFIVRPVAALRRLPLLLIEAARQIGRSHMIFGEFDTDVNFRSAKASVS